MIRFLGKLPTKAYVALSGGPDSMAILDFLCYRDKRDITALHYNHGTKHGAEAETFIRKYCSENQVKLFVGNIKDFREKKRGESPEEYWRNARYEFFDKYADAPIITAHNWDDQVESYLFTMIRNGSSSLIPYKRGNYLRPFTVTRKSTLESWCDRKNVPYLVDPSNLEDVHTRSFIRNNLVPNALRVNPGLHKLVKKKVIMQYEVSENTDRMIGDFNEQNNRSDERSD